MNQCLHNNGSGQLEEQGGDDDGEQHLRREILDRNHGSRVDVTHGAV